MYRVKNQTHGRFDVNGTETVALLLQHEVTEFVHRRELESNGLNPSGSSFSGLCLCVCFHYLLLSVLQGFEDPNQK